MTGKKLCGKAMCTKKTGHGGRCEPYVFRPLMAGLPDEIINKIGKTSQTRGAQPPDRVPYQNRVARWNRAVVPYFFHDCVPPGGYEGGSTVMIRPEQYFDDNRQRRDDVPEHLVLGENAFLYYDNRKAWNKYNPDELGLDEIRLMLDGVEVEDRKGGTAVQDVGHYIARVPATTTQGDAGAKVARGPPQGIRFFEYASREDTWKAQLQLAWLAWHSEDIAAVAAGGIPAELTEALEMHGLLQINQLEAISAVKEDLAICPLCKVPIKASELMTRVEQAEGREIFDLTVTESNLFHMDDLAPGRFGHRPYRLAWGHHHCNAAARDMGLDRTYDWMQKILVNAGRIPEDYAVDNRDAAEVMSMEDLDPSS